RVEVCRPDQPNLATADLEIEFEICERADALERAASLADELHADVAVAPGVLQAETQPVIGEPAAAPADREREFEAAFQTAAEHDPQPVAVRSDLPEKEPPQVIDFPVMEHAPLPPVQFLEESTARKAEVLHSANEAPEAVDRPRPADPVPYLAQLTPF